MSTVTDLGQIGLLLQPVGSPGNPQPTDMTQTDGPVTTTSRRLGQNLEQQRVFQVTGSTTATSVLGTPACTPGSIVLEGTLAIVQWFSYADAAANQTPFGPSVINVSAMRIG